MRTFTIENGQVAESDALPHQLPQTGFIWVACSHSEFEAQQNSIQAMLQKLAGTQLVDLHISDLLNSQLTSYYDYTSLYDIMVFRRLIATTPTSAASALSTPLQSIETSPIGFAVFDKILLTIHPADCAVLNLCASRLVQSGPTETRSMLGARQPTSPADMMLRIINLIIDAYLELRRDLTRQLDHWQTKLLQPSTSSINWNALLLARLSLHTIDEICEDQRAAIQDWIDTLETWPTAETTSEQRERDLLKVRSRDVLEHIERVSRHVQRLEQSAETAVQMHFNAQSNRTNDIMRTLTALTAIFLPLNLITGIFGMNFERMPPLKEYNAFYWTLAGMGCITLALVLIFWRKRYLARSDEMAQFDNFN